MTKGAVFDFIGLYTAILKDIAVYFPNDQKEWDKDLIHLISLCQTRGDPVFTMDLPALGKCLDKALSTGLLAFDGKPLSRSSHYRSVIPRLFRGLWKRIADDSGCLMSDIDPAVVSSLRQLLYAGVDVKAECAPRYLYEATKEFYDVEQQLPPPSPSWDGDGSDFGESNQRHLRDMVGLVQNEPLFHKDEGLLPVLDSVQRLSDRICRVFSGFDPGQLDFRHGPGVVSDVRKGEYKYAFPNWPPRLEYYFPYDLCGSTSLEIGGIDTSVGYGWDSHEPHSVLRAVPKTMKGPRLIAKEPVSHQWIQQGIMRYLYTAVAKSWIGQCIVFNDQNPSREMALQASKTGKHATIDLKSASDRISCSLVERVFRSAPILLGSMAACRTRFIDCSIDSAIPSLVKLRKFSTQGSALTFPVQSLVFLAICLGVGSYLHPRRDVFGANGLCRQVRIYGDDLIVPVEWEPLVREVLTSLHLRVNLTKTHTGGNFRESCGMDAFRGHDVTPAHVLSRPVESDPASIASHIAVSNNFYVKGWWRVMEWLDRSTPGSLLKRIPLVSMDSGMFGRKTSMGYKVHSSVKERWNENLHRWELKLLSVNAKSTTVRQDTAACLLQYFTEEPPPYIDYESGVAVAGVPVFRAAWVPKSDLLMV